MYVYMYMYDVRTLYSMSASAAVSLGSGSTPRPGSRGRYVTAALQHWKVVVGYGEEGLLWHPFVREHVEVRLGGTSLPVYAKMNTVGRLYKGHIGSS